MRFLLLTGLCGIFIGSALAQDSSGDRSDAADWLDRYRANALERWEPAIQELELRDRDEPDPADGILLLGSSSIRLWDTAAVELAPYRIIRRGYGGAKFSDLAIYAERLIQPHQYRGLVVFVANDISGSPQDHSVEEVERLVRHVLSVSRSHQPDAPILIVEVTPTPKRFHVWPEIRELNARLREIGLTEPNVHFVATADHYLDSHQRPIAGLFREDALHQNEAGYEIWGTLIRSRLDEVFRELTREQASADAPSRPVE